MLKLRKIELLGFKSFADKTEIAFNGAGVAAIVGPNGCGKSNVSDAIHWVLGEQSAKTLRTGRMQDVLFNGTPSRKATGLAEVRLTLFDPDAAAMREAESQPLPYDTGSDGLVTEALSEIEPPANGCHSARLSACMEAGGLITVARRLFASGESEYLLNDRLCRLRDIQEIFLGTGLGPDSYAIIEQGRVGQILGARPDERRALIEEAAGITKFKAKRKLAWAKLESSRQNLARVSDIFQEVTKQLHSLERQAARARRHHDLRAQMQSQLRQLLASRACQAEQQLAQAALELGMLRRIFEEQAGRSEQHDREQHTLRQLLEERERELRQAVEERTTLRLEAERARGRMAAQAQQMQDLEQRLEESRMEQVQLQTRQEAQRAEQQECIRVAAGLREEHEQLTIELRGWETSVRVCELDLEAKDQRREQVGREMLEAVGQAATLRNQMAQVEQYLASIQRRGTQMESQLSEARAAEEGAALRRGQAAARNSQERAEQETIETRRQTLEKSLRTEREQESRGREALENLRTELAGKGARMHSLEEVLARHSYSTETVQRLLEASGAQSGGAAAAAPGFEAAGLLADFVDVEPARERVVEEFLREELEYLVVKDWDALRQGLDLLRSRVAGRATFVLESAAATATFLTSGNGNSLQQAPAGVRPLADCVRFNNGFSRAAAALLPRLESCYLVEDAEQGRQLAAEHPDLYFLTTEGTWFRGALVSAGKADGQGPLALKRELRGLAGSVHEHERAVQSTADALSLTVRRIQEQQSELETLLHQEQDYQKRLMLSERDEQEAEAERRRAAERAELLTLDLERLQQESERSRTQWSQDNYQLAETEKRRSEMEAEISALQSAAAERKAQRDASRQQQNEISGKLAAMEERRRSAAETLDRLEQAAEELAARSGHLEADCQRWTAQREQWQTECRSLEQQVEDAGRRCQALEARIGEIESGGTEQRLRLQQLEQQAQSLRRELDETREKKNAAEILLARLQAEREHLQDTCRTELGEELEAVLSGFTSEAVPEAERAPLLMGMEELAQADQQYRALRSKLENLGPINMMALEEFEECRGRREFLEKQQQDLQDSIRDTTEAIAEIDTVCNRQFGEAFEQINAHFQRTFTQLFGGGHGLLRLMEEEDAAEAGKSLARREEAGVEISAQPPGKRLQNVLLLSGGEKALCALALLLAIFRYRPSPFCVLDEVDAPLDDANVGRFTEMVREMSQDTQFILITHSRRTMSAASVMYGVTMQEPGVSKMVSVRFQGSGGSGREAASPAGEEAVADRSRALAEAVA